MDCLDDNAASEFVSGSLVGSALTRVESHLASCRDCRQLVAALAGDEVDSHAETHKHEKVTTDSQLSKRPVRQLHVGDRVGRYLVLSTLGAGGMGVVFSAYDPQLDRKVALKLLRTNLGATAKEARTRLRREAQAMAQLKHPNVVVVYEVGETPEGDIYVAMEFVEGDTLTSWLRKWPRTWREILDVFHQAARGLMAAHSVGLLHRDFKPDNVLVGGDGRVRVSDFGLARSVLDQEGDGARPHPELSALNVALTATGTVLGTPRYMAPEQLTGPDIDARSDQFSFCVALYESLYGTHPLPGATSVAMMETGARAAAPPEGVRIPASIARAVLRGLEKDRAKRFPSMGALISELTPPAQRSPRRIIAGAAAGVLVAGAAAAAVMLRPDPPRSPTVEPAEMQALRVRIQQLEAERDKLKEEILHHANDTKQIEELTTKLAAADEEIQFLVTQVGTERVKDRPRGPSEDEKMAVAIAKITSDLTGCFDEWTPRRPIGMNDVDVAISLQVTPDGIGHSAHVVNMESPSTALCIGDAVARAPYPPGSEVRDLSVRVSWNDGAGVKTSARVVGRHEAARSNIDLR